MTAPTRDRDADLDIAFGPCDTATADLIAASVALHQLPQHVLTRLSGVVMGTATYGQVTR